MRRDIGARLQLGSIAVEVSSNVSAVSEAVHDICEFASVREPERMADLVDAGQIDDCVAQKMVAVGRSRCRLYVDICSTLAFDHNRLRFAVQARRPVGPMNSNASLGFG